MNQTDKQRLDRIEEKIDKLCDAVVSIARAEEKIHSLEEKVVTVWQSLDDAHTKLDEIDTKKGYWLISDQELTFLLTGENLTDNIYYMHPGGNLISYPFNQNIFVRK